MAHAVQRRPRSPPLAKHSKLEYSGIEADANSGRAHWEAHYIFSATGRTVHNIIDGTFTFTPDGLIATHRDRFNFWHWSRRALGLPGRAAGLVAVTEAQGAQHGGGELEEVFGIGVRGGVAETQIA